ncbi:conserved hypothetical protein [uncultured Eubacteriales bacterium]|uniref:Tocopherol cyclase n=1 Tax=uncultured Eubacteriales bacterium TaxID=172733 RepID=A0A212KFH8_9FIRM|nr:conserved hypothetical protein [uncultured Eubacteriales bacterium]
MTFLSDKTPAPYFEGCYFRHQSPSGDLLALIPARHTDSAGRTTASLQVVTPRRTWTADFPGEAFLASRGVFQVWLDGNLLGQKGLRLDLRIPGLTLRGEVRYGPFTPLKSDIMGPFRFVPAMECRHGVVSMGHRLEGMLELNGRTLDFNGGTGYIETDRGSSFPRAYLWTQCAWRESGNSSLMLSIAEIPFLGGRFTGCICAVLHDGREYRLATYLGAQAVKWSAAGALIRQGSLLLAVELLKGHAQALSAPKEGRMERTIHESLRSTVRYRFWRGDALLFDHTDENASFEHADERSPL